MRHKHECGQCSHIFEHDVPDTSGMTHEEGEKFYAEGHMCPQCKTGPWIEKHFADESEEEKYYREFLMEEGAPEHLADLLVMLRRLKLSTF